ncbi:MAG TPA: response regulator [Draconibacterium sp.]|nr:response regulator [Draconibacterium sp.]HRX13055.1 response regulator [Draconibacterium sp.]
MITQNKNLPILLVEDNPVDIDLTIRAFKKQNLTNPVEIARDGEEAIELIKQWENGKPIPVVILLDLKLPKYSGLEVLKEIKTHRVFSSIPVVVLTSSAEDSDIKTAYKLGANSYIVKPVEFDKFIEVAAQIELYWTVLNLSHIPKL